MHLGSMKAAKIGVALATAGAVLAGGVAQAQYYSYAAPAPVSYARVGPADPCARTAAQRALGWGIVGLIAGGLAGGAAAGAGAVAVEQALRTPPQAHTAISQRRNESEAVMVGTPSHAGSRARRR